MKIDGFHHNSSSDYHSPATIKKDISYLKLVTIYLYETIFYLIIK